MCWTQMAARRHHRFDWRTPNCPRDQSTQPTATNDLPLNEHSCGATEDGRETRKKRDSAADIPFLIENLLCERDVCEAGICWAFSRHQFINSFVLQCWLEGLAAICQGLTFLQMNIAPRMTCCWCCVLVSESFFHCLALDQWFIERKLNFGIKDNGFRRFSSPFRWCLLCQMNAEWFVDQFCPASGQTVWKRRIYQNHSRKTQSFQFHNYYYY